MCLMMSSERMGRFKSNHPRHRMKSANSTNNIKAHRHVNRVQSSEERGTICCVIFIIIFHLEMKTKRKKFI